MKRIYIVLISLFLSLFSYADQIPLETAKDAAISFINKKTDLNNYFPLFFVNFAQN